MAETITLRAYLGELEALLERDSLAEVISHCRYILQHYPQNVDTYRLLAKTLLQRAHDENGGDLFKESAEVFQRVLSVLPNDYVAHLGMSEIREHDGTLDEAVWHLERAYEQLPGNQMLQQALRDLYVKRDGEGRAAEKIQLTRAALARQYINAQLYDQALIELRTALQQSSDRVDLQVLLAETLWESQHPIEAAEVAVQILKRLPNCLPANRILARLWLDNERPTDAQVFLDRLEAVDPYTAASVVRPDSEEGDQVTLARLDYQTQAQVLSASETPEWVQELGDLGGEFDMSSVFQAPLAGQPPVPPAPEAAFGAPEGDFTGWASEPGSAADAVPDWFADLGGGPETPQAPAPAAAPDWFNEPGALAAEVPDWFANVVEEKAPPTPPAPPVSSAVEADWLLGDEPSMSSLELLLEAAPAESSAMEADWLLDEEPELPETSQPSLESRLGTAPEAAPAASPEWLFSDDETIVEPLWQEPDQAQQAEAAPAPSPAGEQPSSGFTGLLEEIESSRTSAELFDAMTDTEPEPPAWLSGFEEMKTPVEAASELPSPDLDQLFDAPAETAESFDAEQFAWSDLGAESQPAAEQSPTALEEDAAFLASFDEPLPDLDNFVLPDDPVTAPSDDWLANLPGGGNAWENAPEDIEISLPPAGHTPASFEAAAETLEPAVELPDWVRDAAPELVSPEAEVAETLEPAAELLDWMRDAAPDSAPAETELQEMIEPAAELPDWVHDAAPVSPPAEAELQEAIEPAVELPDWVRDAAPASRAVDESTVTIPAPPVVDEDMMALFETHEKVVPPEEAWAPFEVAEELPQAEAQSEPELDWLEPAAADDDWLGSFAKPAPEPEIKPEAATLDLNALAQPADTSGAAWWQGDAQSPEPVEEAEEQEEWLATMPDLDLENVFEASASEPVPDQVTDLEPESPEEAFASSAPAEESAESTKTGYTSRLLSSLGDKQKDAEEAGTPAWLAEMEPVQTPVGEESGLFEQPYDPFEGGNPDNVPQYASARDTGILQPDERPDWMTAFTGEELPLEIPDLGMELEAEPAAEQAEPAVPEVDTMMEALLVDSEPSDDYFLDTEEPLAQDQGRTGEAEGAMPDWLVAITKSEVDKFQDILPAEPEPYLAEDTGVLQPGSEPDWLQQIDSKPEAEEAWADSGATDILALDELMAGIEPAPSAELNLADMFEPGFGEAEPLDQNIADLILESETSDTEEVPLFGDEFDAREMLAGLSALGENEVAQPTDSAHTSPIESDFDQDELFEDDLDDESVPDDFSFGDLLPMALRGTPGKTPKADETQLPDWLADSFKD